MASKRSGPFPGSAKAWPPTGRTRSSSERSHSRAIFLRWATTTCCRRHVHSRSIEVGDVQAFAELTEDRGVHHSAEQQPAIAHGLLTASVATKIGGDLDFLSREMQQMTFLLPVRAGDVVGDDHHH
jgi:hypothetical protein